MKKNMQNGRSMIEMLGVLAVIGVLTVGGYGLINKAQTSRNITLTIDQLTSLAQKVRYYARDCDEKCEGNITSEVKDTSIEGLKYDDGKFSNLDSVFFTVEYLGEDSEALYTITLSNLSEEACVQLATINLGSADSNGFVGRVISKGNDNDLQSQPYGLGAAVTNCEVENGELKTMIFGFR